MRVSTIATAFTALLAGTASARPAMMKYKRDILNALDYQIVNLALNLENLELNLWAQGLANYTQANFTAAGLPADFRNMLQLLHDQETAHVALLQATLATPFANCTYHFPTYTPLDVVAFGQIVTSVGEGAYLGALGNITSPAVRQAAGQIIGNEARQNSYLRMVEKINFFSAPNFDTPLTAAQAYSLASQYWSCPVTNTTVQNPAFNLTKIPALNATFVVNGTNATVDHVAGQQIAITWNATQAYLGADVFLRFLNDVHSVYAPLNQTVIVTNGTGSGTTTLPPMMNGTTFIVATTFNGSGPIPDEYNYAIGAILVA